MANVPVQHHLDLVAQHVRQSRLAMRLSIEDAAKSVSMSPVTWGRVEKGNPVRELTYSAIERALNWRPGSIEKLIADGTAPGFEDPPTHQSRTADDSIRLSDSVQATVVRINPKVEALIEEINNNDDMPDETKARLVLMIRRAEAQYQADLRAAEDEMHRYRAAG